MAADQPEYGFKTDVVQQPPPPAYSPGPPPPGQPMQYPPPQQYGVPNQNYPPNQYVVQPTQVVIAREPTAVVVPGRCTRCGIGFIRHEFTCCGICLGIWFFPLGLICCLAMREPRCTNCGVLYV